jgi:hypothetical protein
MGLIFVIYTIIIGNVKVTGACTGLPDVSREYNNCFAFSDASPMHIKHIVIVVKPMLKYKNIKHNQEFFEVLFYIKNTIKLW